MDQDPELTEALRGIYEPMLEALRQELPRDAGFSLPLFMTPSTEYRESKLKLLIVGKETHGWYSDLHDLEKYPDATSVQQEYTNFALGEGYRKTPFWQGTLELQRALGISRFGFLWTNLFCCDQRKTTPMAEFCDIVRKHSSFRAELETLKPDVVVFFTGGWYDYTIKSYFPCCGFDQVNQSAKLLDRVISPDAPRLMLRTYHPKQLRLSGSWDTIKTIAEFVAAETQPGD